MRVAAGMMVKDEADVIAGTIRHLVAEGIDWIYVLDNGSTDATSEKIGELPAEIRAKVWVEPDDEVGYYQSAKMTRLLRRAADDGFDWFVPCDADELWSGPGGSTVAWWLDTMPKTIGACHAALFDYYCTGRDVASSDPFERMTWRRATEAPLPKVAVRCAYDVTIEMGNHGAARVPDLLVGRGLFIRHYPYRSVAQFVSKARNGAAAYAAAPDLDEGFGVHWRSYGRFLEERGEQAIEEIFRTHFYYHDPEVAGLVSDPAYAVAS